MICHVVTRKVPGDGVDLTGWLELLIERESLNEEHGLFSAVGTVKCQYGVSNFLLDHRGV